MPDLISFLKSLRLAIFDVIPVFLIIILNFCFCMISSVYSLLYKLQSWIIASLCLLFKSSLNISLLILSLLVYPSSYKYIFLLFNFSRLYYLHYLSLLLDVSKTILLIIKPNEDELTFSSLLLQEALYIHQEELT